MVSSILPRLLLEENRLLLHHIRMDESICRYSTFGVELDELINLDLHWCIPAHEGPTFQPA